ncbi:hypothetical protein [Umezawaea beigongshangensis]|uniref:hypothetical protein n=1 Tax=Umezawaea beigongshangensis TaxID=2780383 RepID=UPI0018F2792C|nr:hypothetical protein [Umezawaea beigongshangensis]
MTARHDRPTDATPVPQQVFASRRDRRAANTTSRRNGFPPVPQQRQYAVRRRG